MPHCTRVTAKGDISEYKQCARGRRGGVTFEDKREAVFLINIFPLHHTVVDGKRLVVVVELDSGFSALIGERREREKTEGLLTNGFT